MFYLSSEILLSIWLSNEGITHQFHLSLNIWKSNFFFFAKQREFTIKIKTC